MFVCPCAKTQLTQKTLPAEEANRRMAGAAPLRPKGKWLALCAFVLAGCLALAGGAFGQAALSTVNTGAPSVGLAVNPTQNIIYVTHGDNTLTYIDGWTNAVHQISDPGAANTSGAGAIVTYLNGVFIANSLSNDIVSYYVVPNGSYTLQQLIKDPNALQPVAMVNNPNGFGSLYVANKGSNSVSVFV